MKFKELLDVLDEGIKLNIDVDTTGLEQLAIMMKYNAGELELEDIKEYEVKRVDSLKKGSLKIYLRGV